MVRRLPLTLLLAAALAPHGRAQDPKQSVPVFGTDISIVAVPVFVTDGKGQAVRGLGQDDFQILDDGKPAPIVSFQYVDTTSEESQAEIRQVPAARRHFLMLFDMSFTDPGGVFKARTAAKEFVRRNLAESDIAAVATFDVNRGVRILANFTEDRALLSHAIDTLGVPSLTQISDPLGLFLASFTDDRAGGAGRRTEAAAEAITTALVPFARRMREADQQRYRQQVLGLIGSMDELARGLDMVQGRKQVIYFSAGFDYRTLVGETGSEAKNTSEAVVEGRIWEVDSASRYGDTQLRQVFGDMAKNLSRADCVVHTIDVTGLGTDQSLTQTGITRDTLRDPGGRESLNFIALETGGRFFKDTNDLGKSLGEVLDMTSRYYILGYQPNDLGGAGRFHKVKVKVARKNANVSHRAGFNERPPVKLQTAMQRKFETAQLVMTGAGDNKLKFTALALPFPAAGERQTLGVVLQVPMDELKKSDKMLPIEIFGYAIDADGAAVDHLAQLTRIDLSQADPSGTAQGVSFYGVLQVPPGKYTLKMMVRQSDADQSGVQFLDLTVPANDPKVGFLLPPMLVDEPASWLGLRLTDANRPAVPFTIDGKAFLPRTSFRVKNDTPERLVLISYAPEGPQDMASNLQIRSAVIDSKGVEVQAGEVTLEKVLHEPGGRRTYLLNFQPKGLAPGDYRLRVGVGESGLIMESYAQLRVDAEHRAAN